MLSKALQKQKMKIYKPDSVNEALIILSEISGPRYILAGGTDLLVQAKDGTLPKSSWLDISGIGEFKIIQEVQLSDENFIWIGCCATYNDCIRSAVIEKYIPSLHQACTIVGGPQIRNMGTIGGNIANASPAADSVPPLISAGAELELASLHGKRTVLIEEFVTAPRKTILKEDEMILGVKVPKNKNVTGKFMRIGTRGSMAISKVSIAVHLEINGNSTPEYIGIALGAVAPTVIRAKQTERLFIERGINQDTIQEASNIIMTEVSPIDDIRSTKEYRRSMCGVLLKRIFTSIAQQLKLLNKGFDLGTGGNLNISRDELHER